MQSAKYFYKTTQVKFKVMNGFSFKLIFKTSEFEKMIIQLIITMTQNEASCKHKLRHKEHYL